jgi:hypothetical protein
VSLQLLLHVRQVAVCLAHQEFELPLCLPVRENIAVATEPLHLCVGRVIVTLAILTIAVVFV